MTMDMEQYANVLEEMAGSVDPGQVDFRARVPAGTELGQTDIEPGARAVWRKNRSGVKVGGKELPDRVPLWNLQTNDMSMVPPTIALKRMTEHPGLYSTRGPNTELPPREPIEQTCEVCLQARNGRPKPFYSEYDLEQHYQVLHPSFWATLQRRREEARLQDEASRQETLISAVLSLAEGREETRRRGRKGTDDA